MKKFFAGRLTLLGAVLLVGMSAAALAQGSAVPPAFGVAQRLQAESLAARDAARALAAAKSPDADYQWTIAQRRAYSAVRKYDEVIGSHAYSHTVYAQQSYHQAAQLEETILHDNNAAIALLQKLHTTFPGDPTALGEITQVGNALDKYNQTITPQSSSLHVLGTVLYKVMDFLVQLTGRQSYSYWIAIFMVSIIVKVVLTPLSNKQYASIKEQQKLQPLIKELQGKHKNDKELLGRKMMELYKEHGVNPAAGCLPMLVQLPVMYLLYFMIRLYQYQFSHGTFLWIGSGLSHMFPSFLGTNLGQADIPILLLYAFSMYVTQKMTITPSLDPQQAEQQRMMAIMTPFMTTYFFLSYHLPSAFVLYYLVFNILSTAQQKFYMRPRPGDLRLDSGGSGGDGGSKLLPFLPAGPSNGNGQAKALPTGSSANGNGSRRLGSGQAVPVAEAKTGDKFSRPPSSGAAPSARGVLSPEARKVHPKKKRR